MQPTLVESNLVIRPWHSDDEDFVFNSCQESEIQKFTTVPVPYTRQNAKEFIEFRKGSFENKSGFDFVGDFNGRPALSASLHSVKSFDHVVEVGYWVAKEFRGYGLAARSVKLLSDYAFSIGFVRIEAFVLPENFGSQKVLQAAGFELETILSQRLKRRDETVSDAMLFAKFAPVDPSNFSTSETN